MKERISFHVMRLLLTAGIFIFLGMLYWSSLLFEEDLKFVRSDLTQIKNDLVSIKKSVANLVVMSKELPLSDTSKKALKNSLQPLNPNNLLSPDPFFAITLPNLLGHDFKPEGVRREETLGKPDHLNPFSQWSHISAWNNMCNVSLVNQKFGQYETYSPGMATVMELKPTDDGFYEYWMTLRTDVYWEPLNPLHFPEGTTLAPHFLQKHQVTAHDFKFFFDAVMNPHVEEGLAVTLRGYFSDIEDVRAEDDFTLVVKWKTNQSIDKDGNAVRQLKYLSKSITGSFQPLARFVYQYFPDGSKIIPDDSSSSTYRSNPVWAQNFSHHWAQNVIVSCGAWVFDGMSDREIRFKRNADFYEPYAALSSGYEIRFRNSPDVMWNDFKRGGVDLYEMSPNQLSELDQFLKSSSYLEQEKEGLGIERLDYLSRSYSYIAWNESNPLFSSKKVRQALTIGIDRERIIRQTLNGMAIETTGTFFPYSPSYDPKIKPYPFDPEKAKQMLLEEGWNDNKGSGLLSKVVNGRLIPFTFNLTYYVKNNVSKAICEYVATALKELGIECIPNGIDIADLSAIFENKNFDALMMAWALGTPPEDPKQIWYTADAGEKGSSNFIGFSNKQVDQIIDQLGYESDEAKRIELYHAFDRIIHEEAPYTFLYTPKATLVYRKYLKNVFIPANRQDLIPGANVGEPQSSIFWINEEAAGG